jgi:hypothetical protein
VVSWTGLPCIAGRLAGLNKSLDYSHVAGPPDLAASTSSVKDHIKPPHSPHCLAPGGLAATRGSKEQSWWPAIGLMERDVAEIEFPKRPSMLDDILRRSLTDNYRSRREGAEPVRHVAADDGANGAMSNDYEASMNSGTNINLRMLQEQLDRQPLDEIAMLVRALTYGEMIELAEGMWKIQPEGSAVTQDNLPALLHKWSQSRTMPVQGDQQRDPEAE